MVDGRGLCAFRAPTYAEVDQDGECDEPDLNDCVAHLLRTVNGHNLTIWNDSPFT